MSPRFIAALALVFVMLASSASFAQPKLVCKPGQGCKIEITPPPVQWQPPPVQGQGQVQVPTPGPVQIDPSIEANAKWKAELERRARWEAYFKWRAEVEATARARIDVRGEIDKLKWEARRTPDPYLTMAAPSYGTPSDDRVRFPRIDMGLLAFCYGAYSGPGKPMYLGYCPAFRLRITRVFGVAFDPAIVSSQYDGLSFGMVGLRPGIQLSFAQGKRSIAASNAYAVAGLDVWFPFSSDGAAPLIFLGGHVGLGAMISSGRWGIGFEVRGLVRGGFGDQESAVAREMSSFRVGFEGRAPVLYLSFP
jgi:hypothetical protein